MTHVQAAKLVLFSALFFAILFIALLLAADSMNPPTQTIRAPSCAAAGVPTKDCSRYHTAMLQQGYTKTMDSDGSYIKRINTQP